LELGRATVMNKKSMNDPPFKSSQLPATRWPTGKRLGCFAMSFVLVSFCIYILLISFIGTLQGLPKWITNYTEFWILGVAAIIAAGIAWSWRSG
jgi:hypothetical protein